MAEITAALVKELRESTGAGMMDCKKALVDTDGDFEAAKDLLREKGLGKAAKKADRLASEGLVNVFVDPSLKMATVSEINAETDFVAKNEGFINLTKETTAHIQATNVESTEELMKTTINGTVFEEYFATKVATIGENLVVRRFATLKAGANGIVNGYVHSNGRVGVLIAASCDSEKTAAAAGEFIRNLCMHAAAMKPSFLSYHFIICLFHGGKTVLFIY
jgi:elongation factor Ts